MPWKFDRIAPVRAFESFTRLPTQQDFMRTIHSPAPNGTSLVPLP